MPAELSVLFRYPCNIDGCTEAFKWKTELDRHQREDHLSLPSTQAGPEDEQYVRCSYSGCAIILANEHEMREHKWQDPAHDYCLKCDVDCQDWEDFVRHKASSPNHISCPVCGADFQAVGGLHRHVLQKHNTQPELNCQGCDQVFYRASRFVEHLENGRCRNKKHPNQAISKKQFQEDVTRREVIYYLLEATSNSSSAARSFIKTLQETCDEPAEEAVSLQNLSIWPGPNTYASEKRWVIEPEASSSESSRTQQHASTTTAHEQQGSAQTTTSVSKEFINLLKDPEKLRRLAEFISTKTGKPLRLNTTFWEPHNPDFAPETFYNQAKVEYRCPHPDCHFNTQLVKDFVGHLQGKGHESRKYRCPKCYACFPTAAGLVDHCESQNAKCKVRYSNTYDQLVDRVTGGHVVVKSSGHSTGNLELDRILEANKEPRYEASRPSPL